MDLKEVHDGGPGTNWVRVRADGTREVVDHDQAVREAQQALDLVANGRGRERLPNYTDLATAVMAAANVDNPSQRYNHLSAVAHGHRKGTGGLSSRRPHTVEGYSSFSIALPIRNARLYIHIMTDVLDVVMRRYLELSAGRAELDRWTGARDRASNTFNTLFEFLENGPNPQPA